MNQRGVFRRSSAAPILWGLLGLILLGTSSAAAQIDEGDSQAQLSLGFFHQQDSETGTLQGDGTYGYYVTPMWEVGVRQSIASTFVEDGDDAWLASTAPYVHYNFHNPNEMNTYIPYLGAFIGGVYNDDDFTGTVGPAGGLKIFPEDDVFMNIHYRYEWFFDDLELSSVRDDFDTLKENRSDGNHVVTIGFGILW